MSQGSQLRLVQAAEEGLQGDEARSPAQRVFDHWVFMLGKSPARTAFGPGRKKVVQKALELYAEEVLMMAVEGCAASEFHNGDNDRGRAFNDLELILRDEAHIERFAEDGERLRQRALRELAAQRRAAEQPPAPPDDPAAMLAAREQVRALAARLAGRVLRG